MTKGSKMKMTWKEKNVINEVKLQNKEGTIDKDNMKKISMPLMFFVLDFLLDMV